MQYIIRHKRVVLIVLILIVGIILFQYCLNYRKTIAMQQYKNNLIELPYVTDVTYKLNGRVHSCKSVFSINICIHSSSIKSNKDIFYDCIELLYKDPQVEKDLLGIEAQIYSVVIYNDAGQIIDVMSTDIYPNSLREWIFSDNSHLLYTENGWVNQ